VAEHEGGGLGKKVTFSTRPDRTTVENGRKGERSGKGHREGTKTRINLAQIKVNLAKFRSQQKGGKIKNLWVVEGPQYQGKPSDRGIIMVTKSQSRLMGQPRER